MKIIGIALKDLTRSFRSTFAIGMMVVAPLMLTGLIYFAFGGPSGGDTKLPEVKAGVVNLDTLPDNAPLQASLGETIRSIFFDDSVKSWLTARDYADEASALAAIDRQEIGVAIIIPENFTEHFLDNQKDVKVRVVSDPTLAIGPAVAQNMVTAMLDGVTGGQIALETLMDRQRANGITPDPAQIPGWAATYQNWYADFQRNLFHHPDKAALALVAPAAGEATTTNSLQKLMGLVMAGQMIFFAFFTGAYAMMSILREDEEGTLARLFTSPTSRTAILTGKFLAVVVTVALQGLVLIAAGRFAFGIAWGQPAGVALALVGQVIAATGLGVLLIAFVKNSQQAGPVLGGALTLLGMLGGVMTSAVSNMPAAFTALANFTPQGWVLKTWRLVMDGQPVSHLLVPFVVMVALGTLMFAMGAMMFKRRYA
ncbi:MAG: ABC transporter permease [Chloroflexi bacterium]|nr:ABC transporter permease [Chloroflexota bacterium]